MNLYLKSHTIKPDLPRRGAAPALATYAAALSAYQRQRTPMSRTVLLRSYRRWIEAFLDDDAEADRATANFLVALRNQPSKFQEAA